MQDELRFSVLKYTPKHDQTVSSGLSLRDLPPLVLGKILSRFTYDSLARSVFIADPIIAQKLRRCVPWKTVVLEPRIDVMVAAQLTCATSIKEVKALAVMDNEELDKFGKHFDQHIRAAQKVEKVSLRGVELLRNMDLRDHRRLTVVDVLIPKLTPAILDVLKSTKAHENLKSLYLRGQSLHAALPRSKFIKALLVTFPGLENLKTSMIHNDVHWENVSDEEFARFKRLDVAVPAKQVFLRFDKFANLLELKLTFTLTNAPSTRSFLDALETFRMPNLQVRDCPADLQ
jgi:hypothetical protein